MHLLNILFTNEQYVLIFQVMEYIQHSSNLGEYMPAFFQMHLNVAGRIDLNTCSDRDFSLFFHEYIHFLQDLTTTYGLTQCFYVGEYIQAAVNDIYKQNKGEFTIPIRYNEPSHHVRIADVITDITMGDCNSDVPKFNVENVSLNSLDNLPIHGSRINHINVVDVESKEGDYFSFGAYAIKEGVAYILERIVTKDYETSQEFPYCSAEKIVEYLFPDFGKNILNVLALCDISLMFTNPAEIFYSTLTQLKSKKFVPQKPHDLYAQLKNAKIGSLGITTDPFSHFKMVAEEARKKFKSYFHFDEFPELHQAYYEWIDRLFDFSIKMRTTEPSFLLDLCNDGYVRFNDTFSRLVYNLGSPLIKNKSQDYFCIKPKGINGWTNEVLKSVSMIHELLHDGKLQCSLYPWCLNTDKEQNEEPEFVPINPTIEVCLNKPWERWSFNDLCPFAILWKNWGLGGYIPKKDS